MRKKNAAWRLLFWVLLHLPVTAFASAAWDFRVFVDDREIGTHRFELSGEGEQRRLTSRAKFDVKILFVNAYSYDHEAIEDWQGNCLVKLTSRTDDNGKKYHVEAQRSESATTVRTQGGVAQLGECIMTFAYWNPAMLKQERLLNSQDGEYIDVRIAPSKEESILVRGVSTPARRYELRSKKLAIDLWYSPGGEWLALESRTERGQKLIYRLR